MTVTGAAGLDARDAALVAAEVGAAVAWLWDHAAADPRAVGFGQVLDRDDRPTVTSIAATGFALAAWCVGLERGLLRRDEVVARTRGALRGLAALPHRDGFMVHFAELGTLARHGRSEFSTIDTGLALDGAVVAAQVLSDPEITERTADLLARVDWAGAVHHREGRALLHMARVDDAGDDYGRGADSDGWVGAWDMTAEQLTLYVLAAGDPAMPAELARALWAGFERPVGEYRGHRCVYEWGGTLFVYHFPHAFWPFGRDPQGTDWWANSGAATAANHAWCADNAASYPTFAAGLWGTSAGLGPWGYVVNGAEPARPPSPHCDGTVPPASLMGALPWCPQEATRALRRLAVEHRAAWSDRHGWADGVNLGAGATPAGREGTVPGTWYAPVRYGINKGVSALLGAAALGSTLVWDAYGSHPWTSRGIAALGLQRAGG